MRGGEGEGQRDLELRSSDFLPLYQGQDIAGSKIYFVCPAQGSWRC